MQEQNRPGGICLNGTDRGEVPPVAELLKRLSTTDKGLAASEAAKRLLQYGANEIAEKKHSLIVAFLRYFWGPIPWMIEAAAVISSVLRNWGDLVIISALLVVNVIVRSWQENKASTRSSCLRRDSRNCWLSTVSSFQSPHPAF